MKDLLTVPYHPEAERIVDILCQKTRNPNRIFFRVLVAYYFAKIASSMRVTIKTHDRGEIPVNLYAINLATSGQGKGHSTNIIEDKIINKFRDKFVEETFPAIAQKNLEILATKRSTKKNTDRDVELTVTENEFHSAGPLLFSFDSATSAAVKQMRHKLLMAGAGSINLEIDEIGSNLTGNLDVLNLFFELFDVGKVKQKLVKNTSDNLRSEDIFGKTPTNMLLFGTPTKLLDGGKIEEETISMWETGMARRCFFGINQDNVLDTTLTKEEVYAMLTDTSSSTYLLQIADHIEKLADVSNFGTTLQVDKDVSMLLIDYNLHCERLAHSLAAHETIQKAEISHRYFKAMKLAGAYAFMDGSPDILEDHVYNAIRLAEDSGKAFAQLLSRDRNYVKLAKYIASVGKEITHVDLVEDLPFYKGSESQKRELMNLAIAYGYKNNIIIKKTYNDNIEFLKGETLEKTDLDKMRIAFSDDIAANYVNREVPFHMLHKLTQRDGFHWTAHHFVDGHRREDSALPGFNLVVLDVESSVTINTAKLLLDDYKFMLYTTKRHTESAHRYRILLPMSHTLYMSKADYTLFMKNVYEWLPFDVDTATVDRSRKWLSQSGHYEYNDGKCLNSLLFIPKTIKDDERKKFIADNISLSNMERWFIKNTGTGNRSNQLIKYALMLVDAGMDFTTVQDKILSLNSKLKDKMKESEIVSTILLTTSKAIHKRDSSK